MHFINIRRLIQNVRYHSECETLSLTALSSNEVDCVLNNNWLQNKSPDIHRHAFANIIVRSRG
jgi:hypothetical protein